MATSTRSISAAAALAAALLCSATWAVPVTPGAGAVVLPGTTSAARPELAGVVVADVSSHWVSAIDPMYGFPGAEGELQSRVVRETASGFLDFYWRITVQSSSYPDFVPTQLALSALPLANFMTGGSFDADYRLDGTGTASPVDAFSSSAASFTFEFSHSSLGPGSSSYFLLLHSNATKYDQTAIAAIGASSLATFAPTAPVPEPQTWALTLTGLVGLGLLRRRIAVRR